jgi:hypothetical protein
MIVAAAISSGWLAFVIGVIVLLPLVARVRGDRAAARTVLMLRVRPGSSPQLCQRSRNRWFSCFSRVQL